MSGQNLRLVAEIDRYAAYFQAAARQHYGHSLVSASRWRSSMEAIEEAFDNPWPGSPGWGDLDRRAFRPLIEQWLEQNGIIGLFPRSRGYRGWTAACFEARLENTPVVQIFRIGTEGGRMPHLNTPWNPLLLEPRLDIFVHKQEGGIYKLALSRAPYVPMLSPGEPENFNRFFSRYVLAGTPYQIKKFIDFVALPDGTPISCDPADSLIFKSDELARRHANDYRNPARQQEIMKVIYNNQEKLRAVYAVSGRSLPECMLWAVDDPKGSGVLVTKQSILLPDPLPARHMKSVVRVKADAEKADSKPTRGNLNRDRGAEQLGC